MQNVRSSRKGICDKEVGVANTIDPFWSRLNTASPQFPILKWHIVGECPMLRRIAPLFTRGQPVIAFAALCSAEKRDLLRDDLHDLVLGSCPIRILAGLNAPLDRDESAAVDLVRTGFGQAIESDHRKPGDPFSLLAIRLPLFVDGDRKPAEGHVALSVAQFRRRTHVAHDRDLIDSTHTFDSLKTAIDPNQPGSRSWMVAPADPSWINWRSVGKTSML
jgi:hypothetical protein